MQVAGSVKMLQGVAHLSITGSVRMLQDVAHVAPTGVSIEELHPPATKSILKRIRNGELKVHANKKTMVAADLTSHYRNIQKGRELQTGVKGGWNTEAQQALEDWLRTPKKARTNTSGKVSLLQQKIDTLEAEKIELQTISTQAYSLQRKIDTLEAEKTELYDDLGDTEKWAKAAEQQKEDLEEKVKQRQQCNKKYAEEMQTLKEKVAKLEKAPAFNSIAI